MITLDNYNMLDQNKRKLVDVSVLAAIWFYLENGDSISLSKGKLKKSKHFSENLIDHVYNNDEKIKDHVSKMRTKKLKLRGIAY